MQNSIKKEQTLIYVEKYDTFIDQHGTTKLDKNISDAYRKVTGKTQTSLIESSIQKGYIFAWESPYPDDVKKDFAFALNIDFLAILSEFERSEQLNNTPYLYKIA